jgi:hypothetical protein
MITNIGRFTCRNASVVDYCITSPELLKLLIFVIITHSSINYKHTVSFTKI